MMRFEEYLAPEMAAWLHGLMSVENVEDAICPPYCAVTEPTLYIAWSAGYRRAVEIMRKPVDEKP